MTRVARNERPQVTHIKRINPERVASFQPKADNPVVTISPGIAAAPRRFTSIQTPQRHQPSDAIPFFRVGKTSSHQGKTTR